MKTKLVTEPSGDPVWMLVAAMIAASPQQPWTWVVLASAGAALSYWRRR